MAFGAGLASGAVAQSGPDNDPAQAQGYARFQYDVDGPALPAPTDDGTLRRVRQTTTYYGHVTAADPFAADLCPACPKHSVTHSLSGASTWEGNGRHFVVAAWAILAWSGQRRLVFAVANAIILISATFVYRAMVSRWD